MKNRFSGFKFWDGCIFGITLGFIGTSLLGIIFDLEFAEEVQKNWVSFATIVATLVAAIVAFTGLRSQILHQSELENKRRLASLSASKSTLPLVLSKLYSIALRGVEISVSQKVNGQTKDDLKGDISIPDNIISSLKENIEFANKNEVKLLSRIIVNFQILQSRTTSFIEKNETPIEMHINNAVDWAVLVRMIEDCFEYARGEADEIPSEISFLGVRSLFSVRLMLSQITLAQLQPRIKIVEARKDPTRI